MANMFIIISIKFILGAILIYNNYKELSVPRKNVFGHMIMDHSQLWKHCFSLFFSYKWNVPD